MPSLSDSVSSGGSAVSSPAIEVREVSHRYGKGAAATDVLGPLSCEVPAGEFLILVGASGCGKSTLLRLIAGFESPTEGVVRLSGIAPQPGVTSSIVFQQPRLFPWKSVGGNVEVALKYAGVKKSERAAQRDELLERVGLSGVGSRRTWEISGGQQQRVAIARALAVSSPLLLLDEPFAALDALTRERLQEDVRALSVESGRTQVFVTHSAEEAAFLGSRIVVLTARPGQIALDLSSPLPRSGVSAKDLRGSSEFAQLRAQISEAVKEAAQ